MHVLVVDDDIELALTYQELLQAHGYEARTAANGREALKRVINSHVDAILCDLSTPELPEEGMQTDISISLEAYDLTMKTRNSRLSPYFRSSACPWF